MAFVLRIFAGLYVMALALLAIGTFGWFGQDRDPLSAVLLVPLGLPWNIAADRLFGLASPAVAVAAPLINLGILALLGRRRRH